MPSKKIPPKLSLRKAVSSESVYVGQLGLGDLPRLHGVVLNLDDDLDVELAFALAENGKKTARVEIKGDANLECQRCLRPVNIPLEVCTEVVFVAHDDEARSILRHHEPFVVSGDELEIFQLLEDEVLLALPAVAMHHLGESIEEVDGVAVRCSAMMQQAVSGDVFTVNAEPVLGIDRRDGAKRHGGHEEGASVNSRQESPFKVLERLKRKH